MNFKPILIVLFALAFVGCNSGKLEPIKLNYDSCSFCQMTISNGKFAAEFITPKGRCYKFDDLSCMVMYIKSENIDTPTKNIFISNYLKDDELINVESAFFIKGESVNSPMRGNYAAFASAEEQKAYLEKLNAEMFTWKQIYTAFK